MSAAQELWFSPSSIRTLRDRCHLALDEMQRFLRWCNDDSASITMRAASFDLEFEVLPLLDRLCNTHVFSVWDHDHLSSSPGVRRPAPITPAGRATALIATLIDGDEDHEAIADSASRLDRLLTKHPQLVSLIVGPSSTPSVWDSLIRRLGSALSGDDSRSLTESLTRLAATVMRAASPEDLNDLLETLVVSASGSAQAGMVIARVSRHLDTGLLISVGAALVNMPNPPATLGPNTGVGRRLAFEGVLARLAIDPSAAGPLVDTPQFLEIIATDHTFDPDTVTEALLAAMPERSPEVVLSHLVTIGGESLSIGSIRAASAALAASIDDIAPVIDSPLVRIPGRAGPVDIATRDQLRKLMAALMGDEEARVMLGAAVGGLRQLRLERALDGTVRTNLELSAVIAGQLADVDAMIDAMQVGAKDDAAAEQARRASLLSGSRSAMLLLGQLATLAVPGARIVVAGISTTTRELIDLTMASSPTTGAGSDLTDQLTMSMRVGLLDALIEQPEKRLQLGLGTVPPTLWDEIGDHVQRFNRAMDDRSRAASYADLTAVIGDSIELTTVVNAVRALTDR